MQHYSGEYTIDFVNPGHQILQRLTFDYNRVKIENLMDLASRMENKMLKNRVKELENKTNDIEANHEALEQYTRRNNLIISGIPESITDESVEGKCIEILNSIDVKVSESDIEACHRLPQRKNVIINFGKRKHVEKACLKSSREKLKAKDKKTLGLNEGTGYPVVS